MNSDNFAVSERALSKRINRLLPKENAQLRKNRSEKDWHNVGDYYILDLSRNFITAKYCDLEHLGRELGALKPYECLEG